ncbi:MAG: hypothetical protein J7K40_14515 [candidate division Zixibacteria bacterium]|nr:hypothetical protein [candidate division Zixibacteria bacterium]
MEKKSKGKLIYKNKYNSEAGYYDSRSIEDSNISEMEINIFDLASLFLNRKKWIASVVGLIMVFTVVIVFQLPSKYISTASIMPSGPQDKMSMLKDIAGFGSISGKDENSSELFPDILRSQLILGKVSQKQFEFNDGSKKMNISLADYFSITNPELLKQALANITCISTDKKTGIIYVSVETKYPGLSQAIVSEYLSELNYFNLHRNKLKAKENAEYLSSQLDESKNELALAETKLEEFQKANRDWYKSAHPEVDMMISRLKRDIEIKTQKYIYLSQEYQIANLDVQKNIPIVRILDSPSLPLIKSGPKRRLITTLALVVSLMGVLLAIILIEYIKKRTSGIEKESYESFREELKTIPLFNRVLDRNIGKEKTKIDNPV